MVLFRLLQFETHCPLSKKMAFIVKKKIVLNFLGEGWEDAYISFTPFTFGDNAELLKLRKKISPTNGEVPDEEDLTKDMLSLLRTHLIDGKGFDGEGLVDITGDNLTDLPIEIFAHIIKELQGQVPTDPKA